MLNLLEDVRADRLCVFLQLPRERTLLSMSRRDAARLGEAVVGERLCSVPAV